MPPAQYGGARKRVFIGLMLGSCLLLCLALAVFLILPWTGFLGVRHWLPAVSVSVAAAAMLAVLGLCLSLVFHIYTGRPLPGGGGVRHMTVRLFFPLMEMLAKLVGLDRAAVRRSFVKVNNEMVLAGARTGAAGATAGALAPLSAAQRCPHRLMHNADHCRRCGACPVGALLDLRDAYGVRLAIATGGTIARRIVVQARPRCIIAVACERDLTSGIRTVTLSLCLACLTSGPHGPCLDTLAPLDAIEAAIRLFLGLGPAPGPDGCRVCGGGKQRAGEQIMGFPKGFGKLRVTARNAALRTLLLTDAGMPVQAALDMALGAAPHAPAGQVGSAAFGTALAARDRHLCAELAYGCLRAETRIDYVLGRVLPRPGGLPRPLRHILALGVYGLLLQDRTPPHAVLHEAVEQARTLYGPRLAGLTNGALRSVQRLGEAPRHEDFYRQGAADPLGALACSARLRTGWPGSGRGPMAKRTRPCCCGVPAAAPGVDCGSMPAALKAPPC